jgi:hypothetical protein
MQPGVELGVAAEIPDRAVGADESVLGRRPDIRSSRRCSARSRPRCDAGTCAPGHRRPSCRRAARAGQVQVLRFGRSWLCPTSAMPTALPKARQTPVAVTPSGRKKFGLSASSRRRAFSHRAVPRPPARPAFTYGDLTRRKQPLDHSDLLHT